MAKQHLVISLLAALAAGLAAVLAAGGRRPVAPPGGTDFFLARSPDDPLKVTEARHRELPGRFGDFDLKATVELGVHTELDLVLHDVVPQISGAPFHERFAVLRLSTRAAGPAFLSREQALFGEQAGGFLLAPGRAATLWVQGRGRWLRANVAGRWLPWFEDRDEQGNIALVGRGGTTLVRYLKVLRRPRARGVPVWLPCGIGGALLALLLLRCGVSGSRLAAAWVVFLPLGGYLAWALVLSRGLASTTPSGAALGLAAATGLPLALGVCLRRGRAMGLVLGLVCGLGILEATARLEQARLLEDPRLSLYFGSLSGRAPFDALAQQLHGSSQGVQTVEGAADRLMFLGGASLFQNGEAENHVGLRTAIELSRRLGHEVDGIVAPTVFASAFQQLLLFRRFYLGLHPRVVVFGLSRHEAERSERMRARILYRRLAAGVGPRAPLSVLWRLWTEQESGDQPPSTPEDLRSTLSELAELCRAHGMALVLTTDSDVDPDLVGVLERFAQDHSLPLVRGVLTRQGKARVKELVRVIASLP